VRALNQAHGDIGSNASEIRRTLPASERVYSGGAKQMSTARDIRKLADRAKVEFLRTEAIIGTLAGPSSRAFNQAADHGGPAAAGPLRLGGGCWIDGNHEVAGDSKGVSGAVSGSVMGGSAGVLLQLEAGTEVAETFTFAPFALTQVHSVKCQARGQSRRRCWPDWFIRSPS
jgi:hypothetical protein